MAFKMKGFPTMQTSALKKNGVPGDAGQMKMTKEKKELKSIVERMKEIEAKLKTPNLPEEEKKRLEDKLLELSTTYEGQEYTDTGGVSPAKEIGRKRKLNKDKTLKSEHKDTWVYKGENINEKIIDLQDRIGFIKEDIFNQEGGATAKQNKDIAAMEKRIAALRAQKK
jgi:hypothetical protein